MKLTLILIVLSCVIQLFAQAEPPVRMIAEWEPALGTLIRWPLGIPSTLVVELAEDDSLYVLVENQSQEQQAVNTFNSWGVDLDHCRFIYADTYSHWTRDWGPQCYFDGLGEIGILDPMFDGYPWVPPASRDWSEDDAVNHQFGLQMGWSSQELPAYLTGGNVMYDGYGAAFSSQQILNENSPLMSPDDFFDLMQEYAGINEYNIISNFENYGIQHIDCIAKLLDEETVLIKEVDIWHPEYDLIENVADEFAGFTNCFARPYNIIRIFCDYYEGNDVAAYTNSLILNKKVLVPLFGISSDDEAIATYQQAMPGYEIIGIPYADWYYYDALHCRTMGIFDPDMIRIEHSPLAGTIFSDEDYSIECRMIDYSQQGFIASELKLFWRVNAGDWNAEILQFTIADSFSIEIPHQPQGSVIDYYLSATSLSGNSATKPITAPAAFFSFICQDLTDTDEITLKKDLEFNIYPNPFNPTTTISFNAEDLLKSAQIEIYNLKGRKVKTIPLNLSIDNATQTYIWNGTDQAGRILPTGLYFIRLESGRKSISSKCLLLK